MFKILLSALQPFRVVPGEADAHATLAYSPIKNISANPAINPGMGGGLICALLCEPYFMNTRLRYEKMFLGTEAKRVRRWAQTRHIPPTTPLLQSHLRQG